MNLEHELSFGVSTSFCWNCESQQLVKKAPKKDKALIFGCLSDKTSAWDIEKLSITRIFLKGFVMSQIWHMSWQYLNQILILPARFSHFLYRSTNSKGGNSRFLQSAFRTTNHHRDNLSPTFTITAQGWICLNLTTFHKNWKCTETPLKVSWHSGRSLVQ